MSNKKVNCVFCDMELEECMENSFETYQPYYGGHVRLTFSYGSTKFDEDSGVTQFDGFICDDCGEKYTPKMKKTSIDFHGNKVHFTCKHCDQEPLAGSLCYDHAKSCDRCHQPYDPNARHVCIPRKEEW